MSKKHLVLLPSFSVQFLFLFAVHVLLFDIVTNAFQIQRKQLVVEGREEAKRIRGHQRPSRQLVVARRAEAKRIVALRMHFLKSA